LSVPWGLLALMAGDINAARFIQRHNESDWVQLVPKKHSGLASPDDVFLVKVSYWLSR
jgi:hypothetical protein